MYKQLNKFFLLAVMTSLGSLPAFSKINVGAVVPRSSNAAKVAAGCPNTQAQLDLDVNQVRARVLVGGDLWWDPVGSVPYYEVPIGSNKNSIFSGALWIGGFDQSDQLLVAAQTYRQGNGNDFWGGPIAVNQSGGINVSTEQCEAFDKFWSISRADVESFLEGGTPTNNIKTWPGNGDVSRGELPSLAPYFDANNDGNYSSDDGDYPYFNLSNQYSKDSSGTLICNDYLFGDRAIWWVFNDVGGVKTETNSPAIGLEVRAQAFGFNTGDAISFMTFYKYQIINRSSSTLDSTYFGVWCDPDLGYAADDYVGCDVGLGLGFCYNGDAEDENAEGYGFNPPAVGIDFFQGPLADGFDGKDNDRDGTTDEPNEQIIMSRFVYYVNDFNPVSGNPETQDDYYNYLSGTWKNGQLITYGGDGAGGGNGSTTTPCDFMFPGTTDPSNPTNWDMSTGGITPADMRWLQSAGTFTLKPGAINYITTGVVWARGTAGPLSSVTQVKEADKIAQKLFDNCFQIIDGPNAPEVAIREYDQKLILSLVNTRTPKVELYNEPDNIRIRDTIVVNGQNQFVSTDQKRFKFQGYKIYQLANETVSAADLADPTKAKLIAQVDLKDTVTQLVNYSYDQLLDAYVPTLCTDVVNEGVVHNFEITKDLFTSGSLKNYRPYYFMAISYAYNNYNPYDKNAPDLDNQQRSPYLQGRNNVKVYSGIPHKLVVNNGGLVLNSAYGDNPFIIKRIEGTGNGGNVLDLSEATVNEILSSPLNRAVHPVYQPGRGPLGISIYDPVAVRAGGFKIRFNGVADTSRYFINDMPVDTVVDSSAFPIQVKIEQLLERNKLAFSVYKVTGDEPGDNGTDNGFLEATQEFSDPSKNWLTGIADNDAVASRNWILSGSATTDLGDPDQIYEGVIGGTWAPYKLAARTFVGAPKWSNAVHENFIKWQYLSSVDVVITSDKSKWTRSVVLETGEDTMPNINAAKKLDPRKQASVDKEGRPYNDPNANFADASLTDTVGMGWFPGYAINVETGERLNIAFGENSSLVGMNSRDMIWNPTSSSGLDSNGRLANGGMHYIYIFNKNLSGPSDIPIYDNGKKLDSLLSLNSAVAKRNVYKDCIWTSLPLLGAGHSLLESDVKIRLRVRKNYNNLISLGETPVNGGNPMYEFEVPSSVVASAGSADAAKSALDLIRVVPNPYYAYSSYEKTRKDQLDTRVRVTNLPAKCTVSIYTINGTLVRQYKRDVSSDVSGGQVVAEGQDFNLSSTLDWDLKNTVGVTVASGVYIIHVDAGSLGEKVVKWFGVMRPIDLDSF